MFLKEDIMKVSLIECKRYTLPDMFKQILKLLKNKTDKPDTSNKLERLPDKLEKLPDKLDKLDKIDKFDLEKLEKLERLEKLDKLEINNLLTQDTLNDFKSEMLKDILAHSKNGKNSETDTSSSSANQPSLNNNTCIPKLDKAKKYFKS